MVTASVCPDFSLPTISSTITIGTKIAGEGDDLSMESCSSDTGQPHNHNRVHLNASLPPSPPPTDIPTFLLNLKTANIVNYEFYKQKLTLKVAVHLLLKPQRFLANVYCGNVDIIFSSLSQRQVCIVVKVDLNAFTEALRKKRKYHTIQDLECGGGGGGGGNDVPFSSRRFFKKRPLSQKTIPSPDYEKFMEQTKEYVDKLMYRQCFKCSSSSSSSSDQQKTTTDDAITTECANLPLNVAGDRYVFLCTRRDICVQQAGVYYRHRFVSNERNPLLCWVDDNQSATAAAAAATTTTVVANNCCPKKKTKMEKHAPTNNDEKKHTSRICCLLEAINQINLEQEGGTKDISGGDGGGSGVILGFDVIMPQMIKCFSSISSCRITSYDEIFTADQPPPLVTIRIVSPLAGAL